MTDLTAQPTTERATENLRRSAVALLNDIDALQGPRCGEENPDWFGPFGLFEVDHDDGDICISWPNLAISAQALRESLQGLDAAHAAQMTPPNHKAALEVFCWWRDHNGDIVRVDGPDDFPEEEAPLNYSIDLICWSGDDRDVLGLDYPNREVALATAQRLSRNLGVPVFDYTWA